MGFGKFLYYFLPKVGKKHEFWQNPIPLFAKSGVKNMSFGKIAMAIMPKPKYKLGCGFSLAKTV